jgi:hypothetical protein
VNQPQQRLRGKDVHSESYSTDKGDNHIRSIPVRISGHDKDIYNPSADDELGDFIQHVRKKSKRFFVGGFMPSISENSIRGYVKAVGGPNIISVDIIKPRNGNDVILRLTVETYNSNMLIENSFWPDGVRCRPWFSRPSYNRHRANYTDRYTQNNGNSARAGGYRRQDRYEVEHREGRIVNPK